MKAFAYPVLLLLFISCNQPITSNEGENIKEPAVTYIIINARNENQFYDIYIQDTSAIKALNDYLKNKYNGAHNTYLQLNYFNDSIVAKSYFKNQFDENLSEKIKDKLFKSFIANYKYNPSTRYDQLEYEH